MNWKISQTFATVPAAPLAQPSQKQQYRKSSQSRLSKLHWDPLSPLRQRIDCIEVRNQKSARFLAKVIPAQCPFERDINLLGRKVAHIPPLCKLNPLYDELVALRFRALCYLVDECGEDIQSYC